MTIPQEARHEYRPDPVLAKLYPEVSVGGFTRIDGQVEFYTRVNTLVDAGSCVLDFGAGRGQWAFEPTPEVGRQLRWMRGRVREVVGCDVDRAVLDNPAVDRAEVVQPGGSLPFPDASFDLIVADYVLEHVSAEEANAVAAEMMRVLKPDGWLAARTPNKWGIIGVGGRLVPNALHVRLLSRLQPHRPAVDIFPTRYAMNTPRRLRQLFRGHAVIIYGHSSEPAYFGRSVIAWRLAAVLGRVTPPPLAPTLMVFVRKRDES